MSRDNGGAVWSNRPRTDLARGAPGQPGAPTLQEPSRSKATAGVSNGAEIGAPVRRRVLEAEI